MKKFSFLLVLLVTTLFHTYAQINRYGNHFITNINRETYNAELQNWDIVEDNRGVLYIGNEGYILEYDGKNWRKIPNANNSIVRSLAVDNQGTIYAGGIGDFGLLKPDKEGRLQYASLASDIEVSFKDVWKTHTEGDTVWFCSSTHVFRFKQDSLLQTLKMPKGNFLDFMPDSTLYLGEYYQGLMRLQHDSAVLAQGGAFYKHKDLFFMLPYQPHRYLVGVADEGLYLYNSKSGASRSIDQINPQFRKLNQIFKTSRIYAGERLHDGNYAIATLDKGVFIFDGKSGKLLNHYTEKNGLNDQTVITIYQSKKKDIWLGLNNGITRINYESPFRVLTKQENLQITPLDINRYKQTLLVGTSLGVMQKDTNNQGFPVFKSLPRIKNQTWSLLPFSTPQNDTLLIAGTHKGIFDISDFQNPQPLLQHEEYYKVYTLAQSRFAPDYLLAGVYRGLALIQKRPRGWKNIYEYKKFDATLEYIGEENDTTIWAASKLKGIYRINNAFSGDTSKIHYTRYDTAQGLPSPDANKIETIDGQLYFLTKDGLYQYNAAKDRFEPSMKFNGKYRGKELVAIKKAGNRSFWIIYAETEEGHRIERLTQKNGKYKVLAKPFRRIQQEIYQDIHVDANGHTWVAAAERILSFNPSAFKEKSSTYPALIRRVSLSYDSVIFHGTHYSDTINYQISLQQSSAFPNHFSYSHNDISFNFAAPYFEKPNQIQYTFRLLGYDDTWSNWSKQTQKGYTNLDAGSYTFIVKARNVYGKESTHARFSFTITPPWYRTIWAYLLYLVVAILIFIQIIRWYTRHLKREKERLEEIVQARTREVVKQKEQIEHQKDKLQKQRDEISHKNKDIMDSIEYASKIQDAVLPDRTFTQEVLPEHFIFFKPRDVVSGDFYWISKKNGYLVIVAADCTGHGVPGAFMSMLGVALLNDIVNRQQPLQANLILKELREQVKRTLKQRDPSSTTRDGMDIALTIVDMENLKMQYAGAYNPLLLMRNGQLYQYKADRMPIGIYINEKPQFTNHEIDLEQGDVFYLFSDGYQDQFGGKNGSKFMSKNLKQLLSIIHQKPMDEQYNILERTLKQWKGDREQLDDIIIIGIRISPKEES